MENRNSYLQQAIYFCFFPPLCLQSYIKVTYISLIINGVCIEKKKICTCVFICVVNAVEKGLLIFKWFVIISAQNKQEDTTRSSFTTSSCHAFTNKKGILSPLSPQNVPKLSPPQNVLLFNDSFKFVNKFWCRTYSFVVLNGNSWQ